MILNPALAVLHYNLYYVNATCLLNIIDIIVQNIVRMVKIQLYKIIPNLFCRSPPLPYLATMHERTPKQFGLLLTYVFIGITAVAMVIGCNASKQATTKFYKAVKLDRIITGKNCYDVFPTSDSIIIKTEYKEGQTIIDTFTNTEVEIINDTVYINKIVRSLRVDTLTRDTGRVIRDTRESDYLREVNSKNVILADRLKQGRNNWRTIALSCMGLIVLWGVFKVIKLYRI